MSTCSCSDLWWWYKQPDILALADIEPIAKVARAYGKHRRFQCCDNATQQIGQFMGRKWHTHTHTHASSSFSAATAAMILNDLCIISYYILPTRKPSTTKRVCVRGDCLRNCVWWTLASVLEPHISQLHYVLELRWILNSVCLLPVQLFRSIIARFGSLSIIPLSWSRIGRLWGFDGRLAPKWLTSREKGCTWYRISADTPFKLDAIPRQHPPYSVSTKNY